MIDTDFLDKILMEHMMLMIAKNKRLTDRDNNCATMIYGSCEQVFNVLLDKNILKFSKEEFKIT